MLNLNADLALTPVSEPASAAVPAAAKNKHNEKYDDEKCRVVHVDLLLF